MKITGFHKDEKGHWIAELECGHNLYMRHDPPWVLRPWLLNDESRNRYLGRDLACNYMHEGPQVLRQYVN